MPLNKGKYEQGYVVVGWVVGGVLSTLQEADAGSFGTQVLIDWSQNKNPQVLVMGRCPLPTGTHTRYLDKR